MMLFETPLPFDTLICIALSLLGSLINWTVPCLEPSQNTSERRISVKSKGLRFIALYIGSAVVRCPRHTLI